MKRYIELILTLLLALAISYLTRKSFYYPVPIICLAIAAESIIRLISETINSIRTNK